MPLEVKGSKNVRGSPARDAFPPLPFARRIDLAPENYSLHKEHAMKENQPEDPQSALEVPATSEPDLTEPDDLIAALDAWDPDDSAASEVDAAEEEMEHVHVVARHPSEP
jgi:hypothetical protein